jgi:thioesterase domain-containing protein
VSSGGWVAHAVAARLELRGQPASAVVLLDTYLPDALPHEMLRAFERAWVERFPEIPRTDDELTAMAWYPRLFAGASLKPLRAPTLFVRCSDLMPEAITRDFDWRARWPLPHDAVTVPGDHMTMMHEHAEDTARVVHAWLDERFR